MRAFCDGVRTGKPIKRSNVTFTPPDPPPEVIAKRPQLAPSAGTAPVLGCPPYILRASLAENALVTVNIREHWDHS